MLYFVNLKGKGIVDTKLNEERVLVADWATNNSCYSSWESSIGKLSILLVRVRVRVGETEVLLEQIRCYRRRGRHGL